ncbi:hypothetical protein BAUCODRAFT_151442 [Baudoinia panamericana UAMH 10762]|uniref:Uncharacterized protein n=1 Tax=Baudoinia panamericana (strain UAMH 10762) TaxID=717646 RepID=M2LGA3_BAUPA|nr:uncharacterized protein BAUCODRAFT_151442 [Baudoinia panamericana UAMH 10762]EMC93077.1 hypothetical protein BAUCODRAFT_151442 [Baudoinia panamericana UAMH 10762]
MASTPEPTSARARTPPTPLHGPRYDNYQPYSPRRSNRVSAQSNPYSSGNIDRSPRANLPRHTTPPATAKRARITRQPTQLSSPPSSPASPVRQRQIPHVHKTPRKAAFKPTNGTNTLSDSDHVSTSLRLPNIDPVTMLPTPSKTPKKRNSAAINATARILSFQPENPNDVMPSPRKSRKHARIHSANGFDLYDEERERARDQVHVYTDANARVPELDVNEDNPFVGTKHGATSRPQRRSRGPTVADAGMEEAVQRDEGILYVFRGKKVFRRFSDPEAEHPTSVDNSEAEVAPGQRTLKRQAGASAQRPLTRSAIKPRLLFPSDDQLREREEGADDADEEATTDIEMGNDEAPIVVKPKVAQTPTKDRFKPATIATPPTTARVTRSMNVTVSPVKLTPLVEEEELGSSMSLGTDDSFTAVSKRGRKSPFDSWQRTKAGKKRVSEEGEKEIGAEKRTRSAAVVTSPA